MSYSTCEVEIVIPRSRSSGALSIDAKSFASPPYTFASTLVIAAVRVVLPWSTWPIVPTFTCGFERSNFSFAMTEPIVYVSRLHIKTTHENAD